MKTTMTSSDDLHAAHLVVAARIDERAAESLRRIVARIDNDEAEWDAFGAPVYEHQKG